MALERPGFDFASRDYSNIRRDLLARAERTIPEWTDRDPSDFSMVLVDMWAYMGDILHYYIDRAAGESFLDTATQRESVLALANLFDYKPRNRSAARATVYVSNSTASSVPIVIPAETMFSGSFNNTLYNFYSETEASVVGGGTVAVTVKEGSIVYAEQLTTSASGQIGQRYSLSKTNVIPNTVQVSVNEDGLSYINWTRVDDTNIVASGVNAYAIYVNSANATEVVFGNRLSGRIPPTGVKIQAKYKTTSGSSGNVGVNSITSFKTAISGLSVASSTSAVGGTDGETVASLKTSIKSIIKSQDRAVTLNDFTNRALLVDGVYKAMCTFTPNAGGGSVTVYAIPYIADFTSASATSYALETETKTNINTSLQAVATLGVTVNTGASVSFVPKTISASVTINNSYVQSSVVSAVTAALTYLFELDNLDFGESLNLGVVYKTIHGIEGVEYSTVALSGSDPTSIQFMKKGSITIVPTGGITSSS